ncbi:unnamed protein product [Urochloa decumbens]|uniref:Uncharacterized protein n=1 Tax=Urochloa decumbens TaxID=240449 RepID=A0ABC9C1W7_9POAL
MGKVESKRVVAFAAVVATLLLMLPPFGMAAPAAAAATGTGSNCTRSCGNISIPYPFGIESGCYHAAGFNLTCDRSFQPPKLFLGDGTVPVLDMISIPNNTVRINSSRVNFTNDGGDDIVHKTWGAGLPPRGPFFLSDWYNMLLSVSCGVQVDLRGGDDHNYLIASCTAICPTFGSHDNRVPATLSWIISNSECPANNVSECRSANSSCLDTSIFMGTDSGYTCQCSDGYQGNPYIADGPDACKDIDECADSETNPCYGDCINTPGSFICQCPDGYKGNASISNGCQDIDECQNKEAHGCYGTCQNFPGGFQCQCPNGTYGNPNIKDGCVTITKKNSFTGLTIGLGVGGGMSLLLALGAPFVIRKIKLKKAKKMREKFFNQNHGLLLQQLISHNADIGQRMIISLRELERATNNFDRARVIGGGGHGVVFKGMIELKVVAIKKSRILVEREIGEFINEVAVLSQVNHRNVVKLLGCCLETEVPLLVYEFISNGTLYQHLHVEGPISLPWVDRIRIALEVARALSYLHSAASMPIFHRDIKSTNILLDDNLTAKVSNFGTSRYIPIDQTGVTTEVQGTKGYLDPMYYYTGRLTDKSDVFSFGVLLIELLTRKQPFVYRSEHGDNLVSHFRKLLAIGNLAGIVDAQVMEEEDGEVREVAAVAAMCTKLRGEDRPTMREVETTLESILVKKKQITCNTTTRRRDVDETSVNYTSIELVTIQEGRQYTMEEANASEASRQYTMEEEILLSASYPR